MDASPAVVENGAEGVDSLQRELDRSRRELDECQKRMEQMEGVFAYVADPILVAEPDGRIIDANPAACEALGISRLDLLNSPPWDFCSSRDEFLKLIRTMESGKALRVQRPWQICRGESRVMDMRLTRCALGGRDLVIVTCRDVTCQEEAKTALEKALADTNTDIEDRKRAETLLAGENRVLEMLANGGPLPMILDQLCRLVEEVAAGSLASILLLDPNDRRLRPSISPSLPPAFTAAVRAEGIPIGPRVGSCGTAAHRSEPVMVADIAEDPLWAGYRELPLSHGLRSCWSTPILASTGDLLGTFAIYSRQPRRPTALHHRIIGQIAHLASVAIERTRTEAALLESEERFRRMADSNPEVIWITELNPERVRYVSPSFERIWGHPVAELYRNPRLWTDCIHPEDSGRVVDTFAGWIKGNSVGYEDVEFRIVRPDGAVRWIHERGVLTRDERGLPQRVSGISTDITERKRAEHELRRNEAYLAAAQTLSLTGSFGWNVPTGELVWSAETFCILGYDRESKPTLDLVLKRVHPEDLQRLREIMDRAVRDATNLDFEHRLLMADASVKHVHVRARAARGETGELEFVGAVMDITGRKRAAEALRASEHLARGQLDALTHTLDALAQESDPDRLLEHVLRTIVERSGAHSVSAWDRHEDGQWLDLIAVVEDGRFQSRNDTLHPAARLRMLAQSHPVWSEVIRTGLHVVLEDLDQPSARMRVGSEPAAPWHAVMEDADPDPSIGRLKKHLRDLGVRSILCVPMLIAGKVAGIIGIRFIDQRAFRREEIELTRALAHQAMLAIQLMRVSQQSRQVAVTAERNRLARDIHDTLAQGFTGVIVQLEAAADANSKSLAREADEHLSRAADLARDSLKEARRSVLALRPQALEEQSLWEALQSLIRKMTAGTSLRPKFIRQGEPRSLPPDWDENLLRIGQEVLTNALRHARASEFRACLAFGSSQVRLELSDNGSGFDPSNRHDGFGLLGMKERAEAMGGQLTIESAPGKGAAILLVLPHSNDILTAVP